MDLKDYRDKINGIDEQMVRLFEERMEVSAEIAKYKKENRLPIYDGARERSKLEAVNEQLPEHLRDTLGQIPVCSADAAILTIVLEGCSVFAGLFV